MAKATSKKRRKKNGLDRGKQKIKFTKKREKNNKLNA